MGRNAPNNAGRTMPAPLPPGIRSFDELARQFEYDDREPLRIEEHGAEARDNVTVRNISYATTGGRASAYWVVPESRASFPGTVFVHPSPGNRTTFLDEAVMLGRFGGASLVVDAPWANGEAFARSLGSPDHNRDLFIGIIKDLRRAVDCVAAQPGTDAARLGFVGHSFGALCGGVLSGIDKRVRAFVLMAGAPSFADVAAANIPSLRGEALAAYQRAMSPIDPVYYVGHAAPSALFFQFGRSDGFFGTDHPARFAEAGSEPKRVAWYDADHYLGNPRAREERNTWLRGELRL